MFGNRFCSEMSPIAAYITFILKLSRTNNKMLRALKRNIFTSCLREICNQCYSLEDTDCTNSRFKLPTGHPLLYNQLLTQIETLNADYSVFDYKKKSAIGSMNYSDFMLDLRDDLRMFIPRLNGIVNEARYQQFDGNDSEALRERLNKILGAANEVSAAINNHLLILGM